MLLSQYKACEIRYQFDIGILNFSPNVHVIFTWLRRKLVVIIKRTSEAATAQGSAVRL